jgi:hypothetical protein
MQLVPDSFHRNPIASRRIIEAPRAMYASNTSVISNKVAIPAMLISIWSSLNVVQTLASVPSARV